MEGLRPGHIFVLGTALDRFTTAFYLVGYPVFLWHYLPSGGTSGQLYQVVSIVLGFKFLFEALFDILTSKLADFHARFSRRQVFLFGMGSHGVVFILLLGIAWLKPNAAVLVLPLMMVELFRSFGNALESGTFDGWAVSAEMSINPNFSKAEMFAQARLADRFFLLVGTIFTVLLLVLQAELPQADTGWIFIWGFAILFHLVMIVLIWLLTGRVANLPPFVEPQSKPITPKVALRAALSKDSWTALGLLSSFYSMAMIFTFTWPILLGREEQGVGFPSWKYLLSIFFLVSSLCGALIASRKSKLITPDAHPRQARIWGLAEALAFLLASLIILETPVQQAPVQQFIFFWPVVMLLAAGRFLAFIANPFVDSLIHENIGPGEQIRAYVVSWRTSVSNVFTGIFFLVVTFLIRENGGKNPQRDVGWALLIMSLFVPVLMYLTASLGRRSTKSNSR